MSYICPRCHGDNQDCTCKPTPQAQCICGHPQCGWCNPLKPTPQGEPLKTRCEHGTYFTDYCPVPECEWALKVEPRCPTCKKQITAHSMVMHHNCLPPVISKPEGGGARDKLAADDFAENMGGCVMAAYKRGWDARDTELEQLKREIERLTLGQNPN